MDFERYHAYWSTVRRRVWFFLVILLGIMISGLGCYQFLNDSKFLGFPLGVLLLVAVIVFLVVALAFWFGGTQNQVDEFFGANEDL